MSVQIPFENGSKVQSAALYEQASQVIPGGISANIKYLSRHPIVMKQATGREGIHVHNEVSIDYSLCYEARKTVPRHERSVNTTMSYMNEIETAIFGTPHELEITMAEKLIELDPAIDMSRDTNSAL